MTSPTGPDEPPTIAEYLAAAGVEPAPIAAGTAGAPAVSIPVPDGWRQMPPDNFAGTYGVWAQEPEAGWADNVVVLMVRLSEPVDPAALLACGFADARRLPQWRELDTHTGTFEGHPSAAITGTYVVAPLTLWAYNRYVVIDSGNAQFLIQLTITTRADHNGSDAAAIVAGLSITAPHSAR
ncbi:LpqN/LpqT family lipoprotein [Nocardia wallacei]|uniref:LpqN/LpqT family lipoprotein n=1 Tax=Nocardia wallacei TaxID=480035 RepID=UPI0024546FDC|nr:LpqN/LpqT family lipoprotein [Nocardia wallacei]